MQLRQIAQIFGVIATVDGHKVAAGNDKLMKQLHIPYNECHSIGTIIHMAIDGEYAGHIVISNVIKPFAKQAIRELKKAGIKKTVMLTGDAKRTAENVAAAVGVDAVYSELLPGDKVDVGVMILAVLNAIRALYTADTKRNDRLTADPVSKLDSASEAV